MIRLEDEAAPAGMVNVGEPLAKLQENVGCSVGQMLSASTAVVSWSPLPMLATCRLTG